MSRRRVVTGFAVTALVLAVFLWGLGPRAVGAALDDADPRFYAVAVAASVAAMGLAAATLYVLLERLPGAPRGRSFVAGYLAAIFLRSIAPWGRSGGSVLTAAALDRRGETRFEELLGVTVASEYLTTVASTTVALVGLGYLFVARGGREVATAAAVFAGFAVVLAVGLVVVVVLPGVLVRAAVLLLGALRATVGRLWATADRLIVEADAVGRTERFLETTRAVARETETLGPALGLAVLTSLARVVPLWACLQAVSEPVSGPVLMVVLPLTGVAALVPLPGGTGGVEFVLVGLVVAASSATVTGAATAVLLYRLATYWLWLAVGGLGAWAIAGRLPASPGPER
jgi:uncharacterized protein (TIRG00374 family)